MEPVQMASSLTETFYDLHSGSMHPMYHHPGYPPPPPPALWSPRMDSYPTDISSYPPASGRHDNESVVNKQEANTGGGMEQSAVSGDWAEDEEEDTEETSKEGEKSGDNSSQKHSQVAATLTWLTENYERAEGVCLPRCVLYTHYLDFCKKNDFTPAGAATFGKIIRQKFPKLTTRRLGTRGQSKYHYYGIGIKETSIYYHSVYSGKGLTRFSGVKVKTEGSNRKYSLSSKTGTLLPEFPDVDNLILPEDVSAEKMQTFLMMYRTHCQRILDTVISANFEEVQNLLLHFWQGMPGHLTQVLGADILGDIVTLCDSILYKVLADVLLPSSIQDLPDREEEWTTAVFSKAIPERRVEMVYVDAFQASSLSTEIKVFTRKLPTWVYSALDSVPECLRERKMEATRSFVQSVRRQLSFVHLAQTARSVLGSQEGVGQMLGDLNDVDFRQIICQAVYTQPAHAHKQRETIMEFFTEFQNLLRKQAPVESYTEWIDSIVDTCVLQPCKDKGRGFRDGAADFLLQWAMFGALLMKELTLHNAASFGSFHLMHVMLNEYVFLVLETQREQSRDLQQQRLVQRHMKNAEAIKTQAKVRAGANKMAASSPKSRKRKQEDHVDSADEVDPGAAGHELRADSGSRGAREGDCLNGTPTIGYLPHSGTAFTRPLPSTPRDSQLGQSEEADRLTSHPLSVSPVKPLGTMNGVTYERPSYLSQFGLNSYSDYVTHNAAMTSSRVQNYPDHHTQAFPPGSFSASVSGGYWADSRTHAVLADPYPQYGVHHGVTSAYDSYKNATFMRGSVYGQEALGVNSARGYFSSRATDTYQGTPLAMGSAYGGNFMEIASNVGSGQYPRHDGLTYQEDLYASSMPPTLPALHKHYLASSFR